MLKHNVTIAKPLGGISDVLLPVLRERYLFLCR